ERSLKVRQGDPSAFPVSHRLLQPQTIDIDCDVDVLAGEAFRKFFKTLAPIVSKNGASTLLIFHGPIVCPRMHFKSSGAFRAPVAENLVWPPAFEIAATPNSRAAYIRKFQRAIDPAATGPFRRKHSPIRMSIEREEYDWFGHRAQAECRKMVKVARAVEQERPS